MQIERDFTQDLVSKVARNSGWIILGHIINILIGIVTIAYLARYLGSENFGKYSFVFAYLSFFGIITDLGINTILAREISRNRTKAGLLIGNAIFIKLILSLLAIILSSLIIIPLRSSGEIRILVFIATLIFLFSFGSLYRIIFQVDLNMLYPTAVTILDNIIKFALFVWVILIKGTLSQFMFVTVISPIPGLLTIIYFSDRLVRPEFKIDFGLWKSLFKNSWPLAFTALFIMLYTRIDQLILFHMKGPQMVGYYAAAVRFVEVFTVIPFAFIASAFPLMSSYFKISQESLEITYKLSFKYMLMIILPIAMGVTLLSKQVILLLYGKEFLPCVPALAVLIWSEIFVFYGIVHQNLLVSTDKQKLDFRFTSIAALTNIILNLILIPTYGIVGASIATLISYALGAGAIIGFLLPATRAYNIAGWQSMAKPLIASFIMGIYIYLMRSTTILAVLGGAVIFVIVMIFIGGIDQQDFRLIKAVFHGKTYPHNLYLTIGKKDRSFTE